MWKVGTAESILLLVVLATQFRPRSTFEAHSLRTSPVRTCAGQVLHHWVTDGRIADGYRRECYQGVLDMIGDVGPNALYCASVFSEVLEKLRTMARTGTSAGG